MKTKSKRKKLKLLALILTICLSLSACGSSSEDNTFNNSYNNQNLISNDSHSTENNTETNENETNINENNTNLPLHKMEVPDSYIGIYSAEDLINSSKNSSANYILMNDLDLSSVPDWKGIENSGIFDGNNYVIKNLKSSTGGLFSYAKNLVNFKLENINIDISIAKNPSYYTAIGGLADSGETVYNCHVSGNIKVKLTVNHSVTGFNVLGSPNYKESYRVGGIIGEGKGTISACTNNTIISVENTVDTPYTYVGGILGYSYESEVSDCKNYGRIQLVSKDSQISIAGGICGFAPKCYRNGNYGEIFSSGVAGGIVGRIDSGTYKSINFTIDSCYNSGNIVSKKQPSLDGYLGETKGSCSGGIVGYIFMGSGNIINSYNIGNCSGADNCGAIVGGRYDYSGLEIRYCAYCNQNNVRITGDSAMFADNKAMSLYEMKDLNNFLFDNKATVWKNGTEEYPYPVIK